MLFRIHKQIRFEKNSTIPAKHRKQASPRPLPKWYQKNLFAFINLKSAITYSYFIFCFLNGNIFLNLLFTFTLLTEVNAHR